MQASLMGRGLGVTAGLAYGGDYNPEQWDDDVCEEDPALMREARVNLVSLGVFAWSSLEPRPGQFDFGRLDRIMDRLASAGISVNLANATASPPPWFSRRYPESLPMRRDGTRDWPGARQAYCPSSPDFRRAACALTAAIAQRYRSHPALAMWHVSNEIGGHNALCYCDVSAAEFRRWLRRRYGDLDDLNAAWGGVVWSRSYSSWEEILPPRQAPSPPNPAHVLDFRRFSSDACLEVYRAERDVLRSITPSIPVTTNFMVTRFVRDLDYWDWAPEVDVVANDHYLDAADPDAHIELSFCADLTRGLASGGPWLLMEHSPGAVSWQPRNVAKAPGQMMRNSLQHVARGADGVMFFQWRASPTGPEQHHSAMVPHAGVTSRKWREVVDLGRVLGRLGEVAGTELSAEVAMFFDWESWWALETGPRPSVDLRYLDVVGDFYRAFWEAGVTVDVIARSTDPLPYRVVVVPALYVVDVGAARRVAELAANGASVIVTFMSGVVDESASVIGGGFPGGFRDLTGALVEELHPLRENEVVNLEGGGTATVWAETIRSDGAAAVDTYADGPTAGGPAITMREHGDGAVWYVSTRTDRAVTSRVVRGALARAGVEPPIPMVTAPAGLEATRRSGDGRSYLFLLNHGDETAHVRVSGHELISDRPVTGALGLKAGEVAVVREDGG